MSMEVSKKPEILHFSVLNMTGLSAESREALFAFLHKAADDQYRGKVAMDYQDFIDNKLIEPTLFHLYWQKKFILIED